RRVVPFAEGQIPQGDDTFGRQQAERTVSAWHGRVTIVARLRFHPLNTFIASPPYDIIVGQPPIAAVDTRRTALYAMSGSGQKRGTPSPLSGAVVEADFDAAAVGQERWPVRVVLEGKAVASTVVDFSRLQ